MVRYYPQIKDDDFETNTCNKKEFKKYIYKKRQHNNKSNNSNSISNLLKDEISNNSLSPHQQFLVNYINPNTPYKGMLIYHETGTGKTCTAISIAENFKEDLKKKNKKINVICASHVAKIFKGTMLENNTSAFQCTGNTYYDETHDRHMQENDLEKRVNEFYEFETSDNFGKSFLKNINIKNADEIPKPTELTEKIKILIKTYYSHSFFILDEAHNFRSNYNTSTSSKITDKTHHTAIDYISRYADNVKILFLTATPMFDTPVEIVWILNVLIRINKDDIKELKNDIFKDFKNKNYTLTEKGREELVRAMRGKVSYYKSGHPDTFPIKLLEESTLKFKYPICDYDNKELKPDRTNITETLNNINIKLTFSKMSDAHYNTVNSVYNNKRIIIREEKGGKDSFHTKQRQLHNISCGKNINEYFQSQNKIVFESKKDHNKNVLENLEKYAPKIDTIIKQIIDMSSNGVAFVYSRFVDAGVMPIVLALEYNGFSKYDPENKSSHLKKEKKEQREKRGNYIVITSDLAWRAKDEYIKIAKSSKNASGEIIRVIVISQCANEGEDFKHIRQVHILEPDFHYSAIEQAVGRAIRTNSHKDLPEEKRNCTIYYHSTVYPDYIHRETMDMHLYRLSSKKKLAIREVKNLIEANSITCKFFKNVNSIDWNALIDKKIINSKGEPITITKENLHNSSSMIECNTCASNNHQTDDDDTYNPLIHSESQIYLAIKIISILFKNHNQFLLKDIQNYINQFDSEIDQETLYFALNIIINSNTIIKNKFNIRGKIRKINNYYKFVPNYSMYTNIYYDTPLQLSNSYVPLDSIPWLDRPSLNEIDIVKEVTNKYNLYIKKKIFQITNDFWHLKEPLKYRNNLIANVIIDELKPDNKFKLFYNQTNLPIELKEAINRYRFNDNFKHITSITKDGGYIVVDKKKNTKRTIHPKKHLMSKKRELYAYNDFDKNGNPIFLIMDSRGSKKKPTGKKCTNKKKLKNDINFFVKSYFMENDKYVDHLRGVKDGQVEYSNKKITCEDLCLELNMIYRLLDILKNKEDSKWFYEYWEAYEYEIKSRK